MSPPLVLTTLPALKPIPSSIQSSGVGADDACVNLFEEMKLRRKYAFIVYKIDGDQIVVDLALTADEAAALGSEASYEKFIAQMPEGEGRYGVFDFEYDTGADGIRNKLVFFLWAPDTAKIKSRMLYASSKQAIRLRLNGINTEIQCTDPAEKLAQEPIVQIEAVAPMEYLEKLDLIKQDIKSLVPKLFPGVAVQFYSASGKLARVLSCAGFIEWIQREHGVDDLKGSDLGVEEDQVEPELVKMGQSAFDEFVAARKHTVVHLAFQINDSDVGTMLFELYNDVAPQTVAHFVSFVNSSAVNPSDPGSTLCYKNGVVNRIIHEGWFQAGEFLDSHNTPIYGEPLADENFIVPHAHRGNISFVNKGPHSNYSQFMVTQRPMPYFDRKFVCFGRCLDGEDVLQAIDETETRFEKPCATIRISNASVVCEGVAPEVPAVLPTFF
ncbi:putative inactive peptidyl-prolyl cis-trans isomerase-like 6 [Chytriomyces hyalinus]|nr:putative inactive peptidyl-prolyl cis-trans isomerase-like 6 [Chytriomyces hyalinus]